MLYQVIISWVSCVSIYWNFGLSGTSGWYDYNVLVYMLSVSSASTTGTQLIAQAVAKKLYALVHDRLGGQNHFNPNTGESTKAPTHSERDPNGHLDRNKALPAQKSDVDLIVLEQPGLNAQQMGLGPGHMGSVSGTGSGAASGAEQTPEQKDGGSCFDKFNQIFSRKVDVSEEMLFAGCGIFILLPSFPALVTHSLLAIVFYVWLFIPALIVAILVTATQYFLVNRCLLNASGSAAEWITAFYGLGSRVLLSFVFAFFMQSHPAMIVFLIVF